MFSIGGGFDFLKKIQKLPDILGEDTKQKQRIFRVVRRKLPRSREEDRGSFPLFVCLLARIIIISFFLFLLPQQKEQRERERELCVLLYSVALVNYRT